jgi:hypothetical protein
MPLADEVDKGGDSAMTDVEPARVNPYLNVSEIEQLVEAQARGEAIPVGGIQVEEVSLPQAELDTRYARHSLAAAALLGATTTRGVATDSQPGAGDATPDSAAAEADDSLVDRSPEESNPLPGTERLAQPEVSVSTDADTSTDDGLGLIFRRSDG